MHNVPHSGSNSNQEEDVYAKHRGMNRLIRRFSWMQTA